MLNLLLLNMLKDDTEDKVQEVFDSLKTLQSEGKSGNFSELGVVEPFLCLCLLKKAVDSSDKGGDAWSRVRFEIHKNDTEGASDPVLRIREKDAEEVLGSLASHFVTTIRVFDAIAEDRENYQTGVSLSGLDLEKDGAAVFEKALRLSYREAFGDERSVNPTVAEIAGRILSPENGDTFLDFLSGTCLSTAVINGRKKGVKTILNDRDMFCTDYAEIYRILSGNEVSICSEDAFSGKFLTGTTADRIFLSPVFGSKLQSPFISGGITAREASGAAVMKALDMLSERGMAAVSLLSTFAFGSQFDFPQIREYLVRGRHVSSVILLPSLSRRTSVPTLLLVITKEKNEDILMVDWTENSSAFYYEKKYGTPALRKEAVDELSSLIRTRKGKGSVRVPYEVVEEKACSLLPSLYIEKEEKAKKRTLGEIESDIHDALLDIGSIIGSLSEKS